MQSLEKSEGEYVSGIGTREAEALTWEHVWFKKHKEVNKVGAE